MQKDRRILRRAKLSLIDWLVIVMFLIVWMVARKPVPTQNTIPYTRTASHILVQLVKLSELTVAKKTHNVPMWTLYGDGTLIFQADPSDTLRRAQLSPSQIQHILDVIINQDAFFKYTAQQYGSITSNKDDDKLLLTVDANGQQKDVLLLSTPATQVATDIQATHVFAVEQFLLNYHPLHSVFYAPDPDQDTDGD